MQVYDPVELASRCSLGDLVRLQLAGGCGTRLLERLVAAFGSLEAALEAPAEALQKRAGLRAPLAGRIAASRREHAAREIERARRAGVRLLALGAPGYPRLLAAIPDPPLVLYVRGTLGEDDVGAAVVGARRASGYGRTMARRIAADLARAGVCVVSGLALGIDGLAHEAALEAGGATVAVLPCGLDRVYPRRHARLAEQIAAQGALVSELPFGSCAAPYQFPRRNRIVSGLSAAVCIVEARARSGSLITARLALEQGREVLAVPGRVGDETSEGTLAWIEQGAAPALGAHSILRAMGLDPEPARTAAPCDAATAWTPDPVADAVLRALEPGELELDALIERVGLGAPRVLEALFELELAARVENLGAGRYRRPHGARAGEPERKAARADASP